jgi:predicted metal-dependent enzyme (double-stranded beta helix superfamily)
MCGLCGVLGGGEHWTEASAEAPAGDRPTVERRRARARQVALANAALAHYGLTLSDWQGSAFVVSSRTGASQVVDHFGSVWPAAEELAKRQADPLDPALLARLA